MNSSPPWYGDWTFWTAVVAALALVLSQIPPLFQLFRRGRLRVNLPNTVNLAHWIGYPNVALYLSITNLGGRAISIESMTLRISRDGAQLVEIPGLQYFEKPADTAPYLFSPVPLKGGERWRANVRFFVPPARMDDLELRKAISALKKDIVTKRSFLLPHQREHSVPADPDKVEPFIRIFDQRFIWKPGTYKVLMDIKTDPPSAAAAIPFSFTLFESETGQLREQIEDYKYGDGPIVTKPEHWALFVNLERDGSGAPTGAS